MSASANLHISYLDSIRGLAALTVITEHYVIAYGLPCQNFFCQALLDSSPFNFWWNGSAAVDLFYHLNIFAMIRNCLVWQGLI
jgi:peptidoglycan/LPS O-acetylase OafA/YrhL